MSHPVGDSRRMESLPSYQPSAYYYRQAIRAAKSKAELAQLAFDLVIEIERHKEWIRALGHVPPKFYITPAERAAKGWGSVVPFPSTEESSGKEE